MPSTIEVLFTPADFETLGRRDLSRSVCVVFDVLRATSVFVTALANGAAGIIPVKDISEALDIRRKQPDVLLGGERGGLRIPAEQTGGVGFDLGNSPREYTKEMVAGRTIVSTTTNGTRALRACMSARRTIAASFLNLRFAAEYILREKAEKIVLVCSGTGDGPALEDVLAAGAFCELVIPATPLAAVADSAKIAWRTYRQSPDDLPATVRTSLNGRRLFENPTLRDDIEYCLRRDCYNLVPILGQDGVIGKSA